MYNEKQSPSCSASSPTPSGNRCALFLVHPSRIFHFWTQMCECIDIASVFLQKWGEEIYLILHAFLTEHISGRFLYMATSLFNRHLIVPVWFWHSQFHRSPWMSFWVIPDFGWMVSLFAAYCDRSVAATTCGLPAVCRALCFWLDTRSLRLPPEGISPVWQWKAQGG